MKILIFTEEYIKITKGMFAVWMSHAGEASKKHQIDILLNHEHWALDEARQVFRSNNQVFVHSFPFDMPKTTLDRLLGFWGRLRIIKLALQVLNLLFSPLIIFYMVWRLRQIQPDVVFSHNGGWPAGQLCRWIIVAAMLARVPARILIIHSHPAKPPASLGFLFRPLRFIQAWVIGKLATSIVTVSDSVKAALELEVFNRPVIRIYNGMRLLPSEREEGPGFSPLAWQPSEPAVGFVGALSFMKGPHILLDAFKLIEIPCELALLGPGDEARLNFLKEKSKLCLNKVSFLGFHQDVDSFMEKIELLVVPSIAFESFGMVILEAMKHKKPVICTDYGGMKEVVEDGVTGLVVPASDVPALAQAVTKLMGSSELRGEMGEAGYQRLSKFFTSEIMAAQYDDLFLKC